jgi:hypothetical protein
MTGCSMMIQISRPRGHFTYNRTRVILCRVRRYGQGLDDLTKRFREFQQGAASKLVYDICRLRAATFFALGSSPQGFPSWVSCGGP